MRKLHVCLCRPSVVFRGLLIVALSVALSFVCSYLFSSFIVPYRPRQQLSSASDDCLSYKEHGLIDFSLQITDLRTLKLHLDEEVSLKEKYIHELDAKVKRLEGSIFDLHQIQQNEENKIATLKKTAALIEKKNYEMQTNYTPKLLPPVKLDIGTGDLSWNSVVSPRKASPCSMLSCFDYSRCPLFLPVKIYLHFMPQMFTMSALANGIVTRRRQEACLFLHLSQSTNATGELDLNQHVLNHIIVANGDEDSTTASPAKDKFVVEPSMIIARAVYRHGEMRRGFDIRLPYVLPPNCQPAVLSRPLMPLLKPIFFTFVYPASIEMTSDLSKQAINHLLTTTSAGNDRLAFEPVNLSQSVGSCPSKGRTKRLEKLSNSTFTIILYDVVGANPVASKQLQHHFSFLLYETLASGSIPVVLYSVEDRVLPLDEVIEWERAAVLLPCFRVTELYYLLRSLSLAEVASYKLFGRSVFDQYWTSSTVESLLLGIAATMTRRLALPSPPLLDTVVKSLYPESRFAPTAPMEPLPFVEDGVEIGLDDYLGPVELPKPSQVFANNFTHRLLASRLNSVDVRYSPLLAVAPSSPFVQAAFEQDIVLDSHTLDFRPVDQKLSGSGKELGHALGGNRPAEQFTIVLLTQGGDRLSILIDIISRFRDLPYLNKVVVVWNDPVNLPDPKLRWPELVAPVFVALMTTNSLNNRFLPLSEIETDAVLSLDDDIFLRPDEIIFAFRIWRDNRDRIVGFPSRGHGWNSTTHQWIYNSDYSCQYSLILTGAAFIHKYYFYMYSQLMPAGIRGIVDELMNCEDIAINFLVSHLTRQPPLKVTVRWTFHCPHCAKTLSREQEHYTERSRCINLFAQVYGYNPLLFSQSRADSVLFKTRIPSTHKKCFKFV